MRLWAIRGTRADGWICRCRSALRVAKSSEGERCLGHSDIAVGRKRDPGELFDWCYLAGGGVGFFPEGSGCTESSSSPLFLGSEYGGDTSRRLGILLGMMGYDCSVGLGECIEAFQRRWRASRVDGVADGECVGVAEAVLRGWGEL